jgi:4a-hydroxytetrahydrobiopterin dehydratase
VSTGRLCAAAYHSPVAHGVDLCLMDRLDEDAIGRALAGLSDWSREDAVLVRVVKRRNWLEAISLVDAVAQEAERRNHHPDLCVTGYRTVTFRLTTHSVGGLTQRDLDLAAVIDRLAQD